MKLQRTLYTAVILATSMLAACVGGADSEGDAEDVSEARLGMGGTGDNDLLPSAIDTQPLARGTTNSYGITSSTNPDPVPLCKGGTVTSSGCTLSPVWESWMGDDMTNRSSLMKAIVKCMAEPGFAVSTHDGSTTFNGQWPLYPGWKSNNLTGQDKRERMSSCILTLLNGNPGAVLALGIVGPGGSPFSDACDDPMIDLREGGFFGDLFANNPKAYVVGPNTADMLDTGRACTSSSGTSYCCAEGDMMCPHHIYKAGSFDGPDSRCNSTTTVTNSATGNSFTYCNSFWTTMEPGRTYSNVFTTFVPSGT